MIALKKRRKKINTWLYIFICILFLFISTGFSSMESLLISSGDVEVNTNLWDIHFDNLAVTSGSVAAVTAPVISSSSLEIPFEVQLSSLNQFYEFQVDVVNNGAFNVLVSDFQVSELDPEFKNLLSYVVTYSDGTSINVDDILEMGETKRIKARVTYIGGKDDYSFGNAASLRFGISYVQAE